MNLWLEVCIYNYWFKIDIQNLSFNSKMTKLISNAWPFADTNIQKVIIRLLFFNFNIFFLHFSIRFNPTKIVMRDSSH